MKPSTPQTNNVDASQTDESSTNINIQQYKTNIKNRIYERVLTAQPERLSHLTTDSRNSRVTSNNNPHIGLLRTKDPHQSSQSRLSSARRTIGYEQQMVDDIQEKQYSNSHIFTVPNYLRPQMYQKLEIYSRQKDRHQAASLRVKDKIIEFEERIDILKRSSQELREVQNEQLSKFQEERRQRQEARKIKFDDLKRKIQEEVERKQRELKEQEQKQRLEKLQKQKINGSSQRKYSKDSKGNNTPVLAESQSSIDADDGKEHQVSRKRKPSTPLEDSRILEEIVTQVPHPEGLKYFDENPYSPRHAIYYVCEVIRAYKDQESLCRSHIATSIQTLKVMKTSQKLTEQEMHEKKLELPQAERYKNKKTIVFDLDETLIHCNQSLSIPHDIEVDVLFPTGEVVTAGVNIRPGAVDILKNLSKHFEIIIFTASHSCYANVVIDHLDPNKEYVSYRIFREDCHYSDEGVYVKDLRVIPRQLKDMVLVDNAAYSYCYQLDNGIPIIPYYEGSKDYELKALQSYLEGLAWVSDVREVNKKTFKLDKYADFSDVESLVEELYGEWI